VNFWSLFDYFSLYITLILIAYFIFPYLMKFLVIIIRVIYFLLGYIVKKFAMKIGIILQRRPFDPIVIDWIDNKTGEFVVSF